MEKRRHRLFVADPDPEWFIGACTCNGWGYASREGGKAGAFAKFGEHLAEGDDSDGAAVFAEEAKRLEAAGEGRVQA